MLNFIYYPVSFIMWVWHQAFGYVFGASSGIAWTLSIIFLVFTLRALLYKPFVGQVRSMRKMQEMAPEMQKIRKKYANDKQKMTQEMQKLQAETGANPLGGCLPVLVQVPVFIGLFHVLREFKPGKTENYFFGAADVESFVESNLLGAKIGGTIWPFDASLPTLESLGGNLTSQIIVMIPLAIMAGVFTHITARHSVARQAEAQAANPQAAIMNKLMLYIFPIGAVVGAPFLPMAVLIYWVANNLWTLGQQYVVYKKIDVEEAQKKEQASAARSALAPRPGQKPKRDGRSGTSANRPESANGTAQGGSAKGGSAAGDAKSANGSSGGSTAGSASANGAQPKKPGAKPIVRKSGGSGGRQDGRTKGRKQP